MNEEYFELREEDAYVIDLDDYDEQEVIKELEGANDDNGYSMESLGLTWRDFF